MTQRPLALRRWPRRLLMLVTDRRQAGEDVLPEKVAAALAGGARAVQLREKDLPAGRLLAQARRLRGLCGPDNFLFVNDRVDVALLSGADGVQLSEDGLPVAAVRKLLPSSMAVGRSVHSIDAARQAEQDGADYLVVGTLFRSPTHPDVHPAGLALLENVARRVRIPVVAIGGITPENVGSVWEAGAAGVAVISSLLGAEDPAAVAARLLPGRDEDPAEAASEEA